MAAAASSAKLKQQWKPSRGRGQSSDITDLSGNSSSSVLSALEKIGLENSSSTPSSSSSSTSSSTPVIVSSSSASSSRNAASSRHTLLNNKSSFVPYLPHDDAVAAGLGADHGGIDAVETQRVADLLNEELGRLLRMPPLEFWKAVTQDSSIEVSLDSYLRFRRRWYDLHTNGRGKPLAGVIVGDQELFRRVFMVLFRMSLSLENKAQPTNFDSLSEGPGETIFQRRFFDVAKLLDICAIYGHDNQELTRQLVKNALSINEGLFNDLINIVPVITNTVGTMQQRCLSTLTMQLPTKLSDMSLVVARIQQELLEVLDYLIDVIISLRAFVDVFPEGTIVLVLAGNHSDSRDQILCTLETMHDSLIPTVRKCFLHLQRHFTNNQMEESVEVRSRRLRFQLIELVWKLVSFSYLTERRYADTQDSFVNNLLEMYICNPKARGEGLVQVLSGMVEASSRSFTEETTFTGVLIRNINRKYKLLERINQLRKKGLISLDSVQYDYVEAIVITHTPAVSSASLPNYSDLAPTTQELSEAEVLNESKVSHIKDILPDYGTGFIAACLEAYDNNPEEVIQRILEGTLHPALQSLDTALEAKPGSQSTSLPAKEKGKGKVDEVSPLLKRNTVPATETMTQKTKWHGDTDGLTQRRSSSMSASSSSFSEDSRGTLSKIADPESLKGRFVRKDKGEENTQAVLNERRAEDVLRTAAYAAQYDDEYDDSFDDLGTSIADGVEEAESLVEFVRAKPSGGSERGFNQGNRTLNGGRSGGISRGGWSGNNGFTQDARSASVRENSTAVGDPQRKGQLPVSRGKGRGRRNDPRGQFYVKDGLNYSYKVAGSVAVASAKDAELLKKVERDTIYGLGQGGNVPSSGDQAADGRPLAEGSLQKNSRPARGESSSRAGVQGRGGGAPRHDQHHRKDRAMHKHFASLGGIM